MNNDSIKYRGTVADRVKRIEQAIECLDIVKCEQCHDGAIR